MALDQTANFIRGNADGSVTASETTIDVLDASIFPDPSNGSYNVVIWDANTFPRPDQDADVEILRVTGRDTSNDTLTVDRGQEGTIGSSHPDESAIHLSPTAKMFSDIQTKTSGLSDDGTSLDIDELNNAVYQSATKDFDTALSEAGANGTVIVTTDETITTPTLPDGITVIGYAGVLTIDDFWDPDADDVTLLNLDFEGSRDFTICRFDGTGWSIIGCTFTDFYSNGANSAAVQIRLNGPDSNRVNGCEFRYPNEGTEPGLDVSGDNCAVTGCASENAITDNGTNNQITGEVLL